MSNVPISLLVRLHLAAKAGYGAGIRLPKKKREYPVYTAPTRSEGTGFRPFGIAATPPKRDNIVTFPHYSPSMRERALNSRWTMTYTPNRHDMQPSKNYLGNLPIMDYRFWWGVENPSSTFSLCRGCGKVCHAGWMRKAHMEFSKCTELLVLAYKRLNADSLCVICDKQTVRRKWGVPLCSRPCMKVWMYGSQAPAPLYQAIKLVRDGGWQYRHKTDKTLPTWETYMANWKRGGYGTLYVQ